MSRHGGTAVFINMPDLHCIGQQHQSGSTHWNIVVSLDNSESICPTLLMCPGSLHLYCLGNSAMDYSITMSRGNTTTHALHLLHHGRTSSFGRVLDECHVLFTYFSGIREIFLMLFVWFFFFVRMKVKKLPKILALHLKRFKYMEQLQRYAKLSYRVVFPFELRLFNTVSIIDYWH